MHYQSQQQDSIKIITLNVEGVKSNISYTHSLKLENSILCVQERFLWEFQKEHLKNLIPSMTHLVRCHDTYEPLSGFKLPRGQAGVSISWTSDWSSKVKQLLDGNERIIEITIATKINICIINAYLPTHRTNSSEEYRECLDVIYDIIQKYRHTSYFYVEI